MFIASGVAVLSLVGALYLQLTAASAASRYRYSDRPDFRIPKMRKVAKLGQDFGERLSIVSNASAIALEQPMIAAHQASAL